MVAVVADEAQGIDIQAGFKVFCQLLLQLNLSFNIQALKAFITTEVVDATLTKAETKVEVDREDAIGDVVATQGANVERALEAINEEAEAVEVAPKDKAN